MRQLWPILNNYDDNDDNDDAIEILITSLFLRNRQAYKKRETRHSGTKTKKMKTDGTFSPGTV